MIKTYEATYKEESDGVFAISLVNDPATTEHFIALSKQKEIKLEAVDKEQRIVMGLVLQPDQLIYRKQNNEEFNIVFRADTIKELSHNFFKSGFQLNSKLEHEEPLKGVTFVESWLVENSKIDKSANFGFEYPKGSWIATMKIDNDEIWNDFVKTGKVQGFSVDAMVDLKEVNLKTNIEMAEEQKSFSDKVNEVLVSLGLMKDETKIELTHEILLGQIASGDITIEFEGETLEVGGAVWVAQGEEKIPLPVGDYPLEGDRVLTVSEVGLVGEVKGAEVEATEEPAAAAAAHSTDAAVQAIKSLLVKFKEEQAEEIKSIKASFVELKKENEDLKKEVVELSNQPAAKAVKTEVKQVDFSKLTNVQKMNYRKANG